MSQKTSQKATFINQTFPGFASGRSFDFIEGEGHSSLTIPNPEAAPGKILADLREPEIDLLQLLNDACVLVQQQKITVVPQIRAVKETLNERQYAVRVNELTGQPEKLRQLIRDQNSSRCQYANAHLRLMVAVPRERRTAINLAKAIALAISAKLPDSATALDHAVLVNNCLVAKKLLAEHLRDIEIMERELASDVSLGRSQKALYEAFDELDKPRAERQTNLLTGHLTFIECTPCVLFTNLGEAFEAASLEMVETRSAAASLRNARGYLHEDQYVSQLERAANSPQQLLYLGEQQQDRRRIYQSYATRLAWLKQSLEARIRSLKQLLDLDECRQLCASFAGKTVDTDGNTEMSRVFGLKNEHMVASMMNNVLACVTLVEYVEEFDLPSFEADLKKDPTAGRGALAFDQIRQELAADTALFNLAASPGA